MAFEQLKAAVSNGVAYQIPTEYTRVGYLLDAVETTDPQLQAAIAQVRTDADHVNETGKRYSFEETENFDYSL